MQPFFDSFRRQLLRTGLTQNWDRIGPYCGGTALLPKRVLGLVLFCGLGSLLLGFFEVAPPRYLSAAEVPHPIWAIDLKKYGIRAPKRGFALLGTLNDPGSPVYIASSTSTVAVIFDIERDKASQIAALFLASKTGGVIGQQSWIGDVDSRRQIFATSNGNFVLLTSGQGGGPPPILHLLSASGQELKGILLHQSEGTSGRWQVLASPSGRSILLIHQQDGTPDSFQLLDGNTLESRSAWSATGTAKVFVEAMSDEAVLFSSDSGHFIGRFGGPWQELSLLGRPQFLTEDRIITSSIDGSVNVVSDSGQQLNGFRAAPSRSDLPDVESAMDIPFVSADGQRFGAVIDERRPFPRPPTRTIKVWQSSGKELIFAAPLHWSGYGFEPETALSADGSLLVVVNTQKLYVYKLPMHADQ